jgi:ribosomal-protein-alanine N-acetyltransferase
MYSNQEVMRFIGQGKTFTRAQCEKSIANWISYQLKHGFANWAVVLKDIDKFVGKCGFSWLPDNSEIEISYMLDEPYWGKGYASEISKTTLDYGFDSLNMKKIVAMVYPQNRPSIRVIEKMGMKYEKESEYWNRKFLMYSINK